MPTIPLVFRKTNFSRDSETRNRLSREELLKAEESFKDYVKPVRLYMILERRAKEKALFLQRSLNYKLEAKSKRRIVVTISIRGAISDGVQTPNLFPLYIVLGRPVSTPNGEAMRSSSYRFKRACKLTTFIEGQTASSAQAKFILPEIKKLSTEVESGSITMLLVSCADINNSEEVDLTEPHTFSPSYEGYCLFGKIPIDLLLSSERSSNLSLGESVEVLTTVAMQSCQMKSSCSSEDKCLSFQFPNDSGAVSLLLQVPVTIKAEELGAKDKSANVPTGSLPPVTRQRPGKVTFFYRYYEDLLQRSEVTQEYSCPFCLSKCGSYHGLKCHLTSSHDLFSYEFWVDEDYEIVIVFNTARSNSDGTLGSFVDPKAHNFHFCRRPRRRQNITANHVSPPVLNTNIPTIPVELRDNTNATPVSKDGAITFVGPELSVEQSAARNQTLLQKRQFYHSHTTEPMAWREVNAEEDSEDDLDNDVADIEERRLLEDFMDVNQHEKRIMHLWNSFFRRQRVMCEAHTTWACKSFSNLHGEDLVKTPKLRLCWYFFTVRLWNLGLIDPKTVDCCNKIVETYDHQVPNVDIINQR